MSAGSSLSATPSHVSDSHEVLSKIRQSYSSAKIDKEINRIQKSMLSGLNLSDFQRWLIKVSGEEPDAVEELGSEKFAHLRIMQGLVVCGTAALSTAGIALIIGMTFGAMAALIGGALWLVFIFAIDNIIMSSGNSQGALIIRLFMAVGIGLVSSWAIETAIFSKSASQHQHAELVRQQDQIRREIQPQLNQIATQKNNLQRSIDKRNAELQRLNQSFISEADGTSGTRVREYGPIARLKQQLAEQTAQKYAPLNQRDLNEIRRLNQQFDELIKERTNRLQSLAKAQSDDFIARSLAVSQFMHSQNSFEIWLRYYGIIVFLILIEVSPALLKSFSQKNPYYEEVLKRQNETRLKVADTIRQSRQNEQNAREKMESDRRQQKIAIANILMHIDENTKKEDIYQRSVLNHIRQYEKTMQELQPESMLESIQQNRALASARIEENLLHNLNMLHHVSKPTDQDKSRNK